MQRLLDRLGHPPAAVYDAAWNLIVADLRMTAARYPADGELKRLIAELTAHSPRFAEMWE